MVSKTSSIPSRNNAEHRAQLDSLRKRNSILESSLRKGKEAWSTETNRRTEELNALRAQYEKERYAWGVLKDELFCQSESREKRKASLISDSAHTSGGSLPHAKKP